MEILRQEIIGQELIFRSQVRELHRLYWTQKNMMIELRMNGINAHASKEKNAFSEPSRERKGGYTLDVNVGDLFKNNPTIFNLQLPAYDFIVDTDTELSNSKTFQTDCGIGEVIVEKGLRASDSFRCIEVINLEDSMDAEYHEATEACATGIRTQTLCLFGSQSSLMGNRVDDSTVASVNDLSCSKSGSKPVFIDLNLPNEDEGYHVQNDRVVKNASPSMNLSIDHHQFLESEQVKSFAVKSSFTSTTDLINPASTTSCKNRAEWLFPLNQDSLAHCSQASMLAHNNTKDNSTNANEMVSTRLSSTCEDDSVNLSQTMHRDSTDKPRNLDGSEEDTLSSHSTAQPDLLSRKFCAEYNSDGMISNSECSSFEKNTEEPATLSITDDSVITQLHSPKYEISYIGKSNMGGRDEAIAAAAETLMTITFGRSEQLQNSMEAEVQCDEPQNSSDSFEFMAIQLCEVQNEEHVLMGDTSSLNETRKDENRSRLRRGRRLRDFRREILPGLVSLSRHEICEDLYNIGYILRKNTPKSARRNWFSPVRNRRSRLYLGR